MATHSSILAWGIPWTEEPGGLQSMGSQRAGHNSRDLAHTHTRRQWRTEPGMLQFMGLPRVGHDLVSYGVVAAMAHECGDREELTCAPSSGAVAERSYLVPKVRRGGREECFAGAALKRYPTFKVRETQVRW